jgi:hypothetical protein
VGVGAGFGGGPGFGIIAAASTSMLTGTTKLPDTLARVFSAMAIVPE